MEANSDNACKTANKISLGLLYSETTDQRIPARQMIKDALTATSALLEQINPAEFREFYHQFQETFAKTRSNLLDNPMAWSTFVGGQCDLLHQARLHQKMIARVGDELANWDRQPLRYDALGPALDRLAGLVTDHADVLLRAIEAEAGQESRNTRRSMAISQSVCGLAIVLVSIDQEIRHGLPRDPERAAMATFAAGLVVSNVHLLWQACKLD